MTNAELIKALRICANQTCCDNCPRYDIDHTQDAQRCCIQLINDAADALEAAEKRIDGLQKLVDINTERCEALRKQLRESHESYEKRIAELMPKEGEWIDIDGTMFAECSVCGKRHYGCTTPYCDMCGARMRGEHDEQIH